jgi:hypothetical protein
LPVVSQDRTSSPSTHVILLGDSVFDNAAYVAGGPDVVAQLRARLPSGARASLLALDGSVIRDIGPQLRRVPADATHLVLSVGGNDALREAGILDQRAGSVAEVLDRLSAIRAAFDRAYQAMLDAVVARGRPVGICTIYEPRFPDPQRRRLAATALAVLNDGITRAAFARSLPLLDLRLIFDRDEDFANPIEPSVIGGEKLARAILDLVGAAPCIRRRSEVFAG